MVASSCMICLKLGSNYRLYARQNCKGAYIDVCMRCMDTHWMPPLQDYLKVDKDLF